MEVPIREALCSVIPTAQKRLLRSFHVLDDHLILLVCCLQGCLLFGVITKVRPAQYSVRQFFQWFYFKSCSFSDCTGPYHTSGKGSGCLLVHCFHSHQCESECEYSAQLPRCGCPVTSKQTVFPLWEVKGKYQHFCLLCELIVHLMKYTFENELYFINIKKMVFC